MDWQIHDAFQIGAIKGKSYRKIGFVGDTKPMTGVQLATTGQLMMAWIPDEVHHNDMKGAAEQFCDQVRHFQLVDKKLKLVCHPLHFTTVRAHIESDETCEPDGVYSNADALVQDIDALIVVVESPMEVMFGNLAWIAVRAAHKQQKPTYMILPDARVMSISADLPMEVETVDFDALPVEDVEFA